MTRRTFGSALGVLATPLVADAQQVGTVPTAGVLLASSTPGARFGIAWKGAE